jgi:hypothetical protein
MSDEPDASDEQRPVAFISHHSSQERTARHLKDILERNGIVGWMAPDDIAPGTRFDTAIVDQVRTCDMIVLLFCARSDQSEHVRRELTLGVDHKKLIYPVRLEDIDVQGLAYWLSGYQWIDWIDQRDETIQRLIDTIHRQTSVETGTGKSGPPPPKARRGYAPGKRWWIAGIAAAAALTIGLGWYFWAQKEVNEFKVLSGGWLRELESHSLVTRGIEPDAAEALFDRLTLDSAQGCIGPADADSPGVSFFDLDGHNNCSMDQIGRDGDGDLLAELTCRPEALDGGTASFALELTTDQSTKIGAAGNLTISDDTGARTLYQVAFHYYYAGKAC